MREEGWGLWNVCQALDDPVTELLPVVNKDSTRCSRPHRSMLAGEGVPLPPFSVLSPRGTLFQAPLVPLPTAHDDACKQLILGIPSALGYTQR